MIGVIALGGVYVPAILVLAILALAAAVAVSVTLRALNAYRFLAYRPVVDLSIFTIILGFLVAISSHGGFSR